MADNAVVPAGTLLNLQANYPDPDQETIAEQDFVWRSDQIGVLSTVSPLHVTVLRAPSLEEVQNFCTGDCDQDLTVKVEELLAGVNIALGNRNIGECLLFDAKGDGTTTVDEILIAVGNAINGCRTPGS